MDMREEIRRMMVAVNRVDEAYFKAIRQLGLKGNFFVLFYAIADGRLYSQKEICDEWSLSRTTLNSIVNECVAKGLVALVPRGNKEKDVVLTDEGRKIVDEIFTPLFAAEAKALEPLIAGGLTAQIELMAKRLEDAFAGL